MAFEIKHGDCLEVMRGMADNSVDAIVTDPPYGLSFMGKKWDYDVPEQAVWEECLRVLKPGGHLLAFAGTRTQHRMAVRIEDAGFEIRDMIAWVYGSGFPKSHNIAKAIDREAGERGAVGKRFVAAGGELPSPERNYVDPPIVLESARKWQGWGTALKPAMEPITVARKPLVGTVAANVLEYGTGAINVDGCRVEAPDGAPQFIKTKTPPANCFGNGLNGSKRTGEVDTTTGRWPANLIHDGSDEVVACFPDTGSAARFFYCAKASKADRDEGCEELPEVECGMMEDDAYPIKTGSGNLRETQRRNHHPTVKPTALMRYLCRLVTPPGGTVLDPFTGSGSTGKAAVLEGFEFIGIEREAEYVAIAEARIVEAQRSLGLFA